MGKIYFAHAVNTYGQPVEQAALKLIRAAFPGSEIENPNQPHHQVGYTKYAERQKESSTSHKGMGYFYDEVLPGCDGGVAMPFLDGRMGLGVNGEMKWLVERGKRVWYMAPASLPTTPADVLVELGKFILDPQSGLFKIREFTEGEVDMIRHEAAPLVVSHIETRVRTWKIYNLIYLPYEEAHLATMPPSDYFYLKDQLTKKN